MRPLALRFLKPPTNAPGRRRAGVALVIVLAFVLLLSGVILAFFSHSTNELQISNSSVNQVKADLLAQGALDTIVGDFRQEILAGSVSPAATPAAGVTLYVPKTPFNAVPARDPALTGKTGYENLIKRSSTAQPYTNSVSNQAAGPSTLVPALSGQYISPSRWNYHLLLQKDPAYSAPTYAGTFTPTGATPTVWANAPEWVVVKRTEDLSTPTTQWSSDLTVGGNNPAIGRYAYAVYDEGGLLDINAAGYPSPLTTTQYHSSQAFADLKQLPGISALSAGTSNSSSLTQNKLIDNLVGLRNYATAAYNPTTQVTTALTGSFPAFTWSATNATNYFNFFALGTTNGFLTAANSPMVTTPKSVTDHPFLTRQELLRIVLQYITTTDADRATVEDAFQCLGTFSRTLNQPSYIRLQATNSASKLDYNSAVPKIATAALGGNDAAGGDDKINPSFPAVRVSTVFTRNDGITKSVVGEPLVKKRFPLIYLAWLTYQGPSNTATAAQTALLNAGVPQSVINLGIPQNIEKYFGLRWQTITCPNGDTQLGWQYVHGASGSAGPIMTLSQVATAGTREPDFFELLKASVNAGSVAKSYLLYTNSTDATVPEGYEAERDTSVDAAIMQIGANMVDQFDADSYPTCIAFNDNSLFGGKQQVYRGVEDLPYLYRVREGKIMITDSSPSQASLPQVVAIPSGSSVAPQPAGFSAGEGAVMQEPEIWNPHGWNGNQPTNYTGPTSFRVTAISADPTAPTATSNILLYANWRMWAASSGTSTPSVNRTSSLITVPPVNASMTFSIPTGRLDLFREPTLLVKPGKPDGSGLSGGTSVHSLYPAGQYTLNGGTDAQDYLGILISKVPMAWFGGSPGAIPANGIMSGNPLVASAGIVPTGWVLYPTTINGLTWRMQCQDASGSWVTYDEKYCRLVTANNYGTPNSNSDTSGTALPNYINKTFGRATGGAYSENSIGSEISQVCFDPRTSRFGMNYAGRNGNRGNAGEDFPVCIRNTYGPPQATVPFGEGWSINYSGGDNLLAAANQSALLTTRPDELQGFIFCGNSLNLGYSYNTGPTAAGWNPLSTAAVVRPGMFAQNNPETANASNPKRFVGDSVDANTLPLSASQYYADADGVVRRAMAGFVPTGSNPATAPTGGTPSGLPLKPAMSFGSGSAIRNTSTNEYASRPIVLNRPFRSVAELGYVFSGTPWKNLDFSSQESGSVAMLDVFSLNDTDDAQGMVAGTLNLNTRQGPVLKAILAGAYKDEFGTVAVPSTIAPPLLPTEADKIASDATTGLPAWTNSTDTTKGPLVNISDLVGRWQSSTPISNSIYGAKSYSGYLGTELTSALANDADMRVERFREATVRALTASGQTRVWNLLIDVVAQTGRYPTTSTAFNQFVVDGEQRCWLHVAIDRLTGQVIDKQLEIVKE